MFWLVYLSVLISTVSAQSPAWGQCGGIGWSGSTTCVSGSTCTVSNAYYSQCIPGSSGGSTGGGTGTGGSSAALPTGTSTVGANAAAKAAGKKYFGTAVDNQDLSDSAYVSLLSNSSIFGQLTAANSMKWDATEPSRGQFSFSGGDAISNLATKNGQLLRGHNCVWHNQLPSWVSNGNFNNATLTSILQTHCSTVVGHYKGKAYSWDVVNEAFEEDGTMRSFVFTNTIGKSYIDIALQAARAADPNTKLYINDYNIEASGAKSTGMFNLVKDLKSRGIPIDGIGIQAHLIVGQVPSTLKANLQNFASLGVEIAITELDIRMNLPETAAQRVQQQQDYQTVVSTCHAIEACVGVTIWDYTDKYSWVPGTFSGQGAALPWDGNLVKKPAYDGIIAGFSS